MHRRHSQLLALAFLLFFAPLVVWAQTGNVTIVGTVKDNTGALLSGAEVKLEGSNAGFTRSIITGANGDYQVVEVPPGSYKVTVTATGFRPATSTVTITADAKQIVDLGLEDHGGAQTVVVTTRIENAEKETSVVGNVLDSRRA